MYEFIEDNKKNLIILASLIIFTIFFLIFSSCSLKKKDKYIYTIEKNSKSKLPYINLKGSNIELINNSLKVEYDELSKYKNSYFKYKYSIQDDIISLLIEKGIKKSKSDFLEEEYKVYNISLKSKKVLSKDEIMSKYNLDKNNIKSIIEKALEKQFKYESDNGYVVPQECNLNCYLNDKNYVSIDDNLEFFIKGKDIYGYLNIKNTFLYYDINNYPKTNKMYKLN